MADYVRVVASPTEFGSDPMRGPDATSGQHMYTGPGTYFLFFNRATAHTSKPIFAQISSKGAIWYKEDSCLNLFILRYISTIVYALCTNKFST